MLLSEWLRLRHEAMDVLETTMVGVAHATPAMTILNSGAMRE